MFNLDLQKAEKPEIKLPTSVAPQKKQHSSRKTSTSALLTIPYYLTVWIKTNCFLKKWEYQTTLPTSREIFMQVKNPVRTGHGKTWEQQQTGKGVCQGCISSHCLFNLHTEYIMQMQAR